MLGGWSSSRGEAKFKYESEACVMWPSCDSIASTASGVRAYAAVIASQSDNAAALLVLQKPSSNGNYHYHLETHPSPASDMLANVYQWIELASQSYCMYIEPRRGIRENRGQTLD